MSQPNLREIIRNEYKKCIEDPIYFMKKYVKIQHPIRGTVGFELYPFQEDALQNFVDNQLNIADALHPLLTTVQLPHFEMGARAATRLLEAIESENSEPQVAEEMLVHCPLVVRDSVAPPGK